MEGGAAFLCVVACGRGCLCVLMMGGVCGVDGTAKAIRYAQCIRCASGCRGHARACLHEHLPYLCMVCVHLWPVLLVYSNTPCMHEHQMVQGLTEFELSVEEVQKAMEPYAVRGCCVCVYACIPMYVCMCVCVCVHTRACAQCACACVSARVQLCMCARMSKCLLRVTPRSSDSGHSHSLLGRHHG